VKFQIVTYNQAARRPGYPSTSVKPYMAMTGPLPGTLGDPLRADGETREEARMKLVAMIQRLLDMYPGLEVTEVDIQPSERARQLDRGESP